MEVRLRPGGPCLWLAPVTSVPAPPDDDHGAWLPVLRLKARKLPAPEIHREAAGHPAGGGKGQGERERQGEREASEFNFEDSVLFICFFCVLWSVPYV